jgi:hypothetical protein
MLRNRTESKLNLMGNLVWNSPVGRGHVHAFQLHVQPGLRMKAVEANWAGPLEPGLYPVELTLEGLLDNEAGGESDNRHLALRQSALLWVDTGLGDVDAQSLRLDLQVREAGQVDLELGLRRIGGRQNRFELVWSQKDDDTPHWPVESLSPTETRQESWTFRVPVQRMGNLLRKTPSGWGAALQHTDDDGNHRQYELSLPTHAVQSLELMPPRLPILGPCRVVVAPRNLLTQDESIVNQGWSTYPEGTTIRFSFPVGLSEEKRVGPWFLAPRPGSPIVAGHATFRLTYELKDWLELRLTTNHQHLSLQFTSVSGCSLEPDWKLAWEGQEVIDTGQGTARLVSGDYTVATMLRTVFCTIRWGSRSWVAHVNWFVRTMGNGVRNDQFVLARLVEGKT